MGLDDRVQTNINLYTFILERCSLSALELLFCDFSVSRPRLAAKFARVGNLELRGTRPCVVRHRVGRGVVVARSQSRVYEFSGRPSNHSRDS